MFNRKLAILLIAGTVVLASLSCKALLGDKNEAEGTVTASRTPQLEDNETQPAGGHDSSGTGYWPHATVTPGYGLNLRFRPSGQIGGNTYAVAVAGSTAYIGVGPRLVSLDLANPATPRLLGQSEPLPGVVRGIVLRDQLAYVAAGKGHLRVLDISNPADPHEVGSAEEFQWAMAVISTGDRLYLADNAQGLWIAGLADPRNPELLGTLQMGTPASGLAASGTTVFVVSMHGKLIAVDASDPAQPVEIGTLDLPQMSTAVAVSGNYAYVSSGQDGLWVVDVSNPAKMQKVASVDAMWADGLALEANIVYLADSSQGLLTIDVTNPLQPVQLGLLPMTLFSQGVPGQRQMVAQGGYVLMANPNQGMLVVNATNPGSPALLSSYDAPLTGAAFDLVVENNIAYVTRDMIGLGTVEVANPASLLALGSEPSFIHGSEVRTTWKLAISGGYAYMADMNDGLRLVSITDPASLTQVASLDKPQSASSVLAQGNLVFYSTSEHDPKDGDPESRRSLRAVDISNPSQPVVLGVLKMPNNSTAIALSGNYLFYADALEIKQQAEKEPAALRVIDISNPAAMQQVGEIDTSGTCSEASSIAISGNYAYVGDRKSGLCVFDISNPTSPQLTSRLLEFPIYDLSYLDGRLFCANYGFVTGINVTDPKNPLPEDMTVTPGLAWGIYAQGSHEQAQVFIADMDGGLTILEYR